MGEEASGFLVTFMLSDDPEYPGYAVYLGTTRAKHRFGYGLLSDLEE